MLKLNKLDWRFFNKSIFLSICILLLSINTISGQETLAEKLGYAKDTKLLIVHADDLGFSHNENIASIKSIENGVVNSASIIMPGPWVSEIANHAVNNNNKHDLGLHLAITSEWKNFKWGSVASSDKVPTLLNKYGYLYDQCPEEASAAEVEIELRSQIQLAYAMGIKPTHLDSHMGCLFWGKLEFFEVYLKLAKEFDLPCLVDRTFVSLFPNEAAFNKMLKDYDVKVIIDENYTISVEDNAKGPEKYYKNILRNLKPGLTQILIHTAYNDEEMQAITIDHPAWGAAWRQADYDFFMSDLCKKIIEEEKITLVTWREISAVLK